MMTIGAILALVFSLQASAAGAVSMRMATAALIDPAGKSVGYARFLELPNGKVLVFARVNGLAGGEHGMHVHTTGACAPTFAAAGGHFNPSGQMHGSHAGDLGNITVSSSGRASALRLTDRFTLSPGPLSLLDADGSALVIHANVDDLMTDPAGNSGDRVACGVIEPMSLAMS